MPPARTSPLAALVVAVAALAALAACGGDPAPAGPDGGGGGLDGGATDPSAELFAAEAFPRFELELSPEAIAALEADPATYVPATFRYGDEVVTDVGVRLKGEYTFRPLTAKASFKIKFDELVPDQTFRGLRRLTLNNALEDPSFVAERLTYLAFREAGLPAPRANSAEVVVNGEPYGVYTHLETEDKTFLARWFGSADGNLYEELGNDWLPGNEGGFELETNETTDDRSDLTALFAAVTEARDGALLEDVAAILDVDRFLRYCALEGLVNQWDGYAYTRFGPNNYRLYHDPSTGRFSVLPWGMDMSMKPYDVPFVDVHQASGAFLARCMADGACRAEFDRVLAEEAARFDALDLPARAQAYRDQIADAVAADPRKEASDEDVAAAFQAVVDTARGRTAALGL